MMDREELTEAEQRHFWRVRWLSALQAFADFDVQRSKWVDPQEANPHFSFVECMCCYFDDCDIADQEAVARRIGRGYLSAAEANSVADFHLIADQYTPPEGDVYDVNAILADPAWTRVVQAARKAQDSLQLILTNKDEVAALTRPSVWTKRGAGFVGIFPEAE